MTNTERTLTKPSLVVIVGATTTGKTKLAASLARVLGGELVNADKFGSVRSLAQTAHAQMPLRRREEWVHPSQIKNLHGRWSGPTKEYPCPRLL